MKPSHKIYLATVFGILSPSLRRRVVNNVKKYKFLVRDGSSSHSSTWWFSTREEAQRQVLSLKEGGAYAFLQECASIYLDGE